MRPRTIQLILLLATLMLAGCIVPADAIRPGGLLIIELVRPNVFRVGGRIFTSGDLGVAMGQSARSHHITNIEVYIPSKLLEHTSEFACDRLMRRVFIETGLPWSAWKYYVWTPRDESTKKEIECDIPLVASNGVTGTSTFW